MPRPRRPWFRFYVEAIYDRKLRRLQPAQRWLWVVVLAAARQSKVPGVLVDVDDEDLADMAAMPVKDVRRTMPMFETFEMVRRDELLHWEVVNWQERQYESDDITERTRRHRSNHPERNDVGTFQRRSREQDAASVGTFPGTMTEAETDTEVITRAAVLNPRPVDNSAAALIDEALNILADRRIAAANGSVANPGAYKAAAIRGLRDQYADQLYDASDAHTAESLANWLEPPPPPVRTDFAPGTGRIPNWSKGES